MIMIRQLGGNGKGKGKVFMCVRTCLKGLMKHKIINYSCLTDVLKFIFRSFKHFSHQRGETRLRNSPHLTKIFQSMCHLFSYI